MPAVAVRTIKISVSVPAAEFPLDGLPAKGTPGSKNVVLPYEFATPNGAKVSADVKAPALQRVSEQAAANGGAGYITIQGKLGDAGRIEEVGVVYMPPAAPKPAA